MIMRKLRLLTIFYVHNSLNITLDCMLIIKYFMCIQCIRRVVSAVIYYVNLTWPISSLAMTCSGSVNRSDAVASIHQKHINKSPSVSRMRHAPVRRH
jgi:hypothetical protein